MKEIIINYDMFECIKHIDEFGFEYWLARELMPVLQYSNWQNFEKIIDKSKIACENSGINVSEHFTGVSKTIIMPKNATKKITDYKLSRYACYLIAQNGDSRKKTIALAQTYFAVQTRKMEIVEKELYVHKQKSSAERNYVGYTRNTVRRCNRTGSIFCV